MKGERRGIGIKKLSPNDERALVQAFKGSIPPKVIAERLGVTRRYIQRRYQKLRGYPLKPWVITMLKRNKPLVPTSKLEAKPKAKKPLVDASRFYRSDFIPS